MLNTIELTSELPSLAAGLVAGVLFGGLYFGGLWWTIHRMPQARHPLRLYFGSLIVRLLFVLAAFYIGLKSSSGPALATSLVGFFAARLALFRWLGQASSTEASQAKVL